MRKEIEEQLNQARKAIIAATMPISAMEAADLISKLESEGRPLVVFFSASDHSVYLKPLLTTKA